MSLLIKMSVEQYRSFSDERECLLLEKSTLTQATLACTKRYLENAVYALCHCVAGLCSTFDGTSWEKITRQSILT